MVLAMPCHYPVTVNLARAQNLLDVLPLPSLFVPVLVRHAPFNITLAVDRINQVGAEYVR